MQQFLSKKILILTLIALTFYNCKEKEEKLPAILEEEIVETPTLEMGCYLYDENESLISLEITKSNNPIEGNLTYALAEKDKNIGTFQGTFEDGKLVGIYTFISEGIESKRPVTFQLQDNQLMEGYGTLNEDGTAFKDNSSVTYSTTMPLRKADCLK